MLGVVLMLIVYSSLNAVLWRQYRTMTGVLWQGTQSVRDLSPGIQDRSLAWTQDPAYFDWLVVDQTLIEYPMGVTGTVEMVDDWWVGVTAAVGLTLLLGLVLGLVIRRAMGPRRTGLSAAFYRLAHIRAGRARIVRNAVWVFALALPLAGGLAWYVFYDRAQTSTAPDGGFRAVRYLSQSFSPRGRDWAFVTLAGLGAAVWYAWWAGRRLVRGWRPDVFAPFHTRCAGCGYSLEGIDGRCPECDLPVDTLVPGRGPLTPHRVALATVAALVLALVTGSAVVWARHEGHVYWPVHHWVTMRGETRKFHPDLYVLPNRPTMLRWGGTEVWIVVRNRDVDDPNDRPVIGYKVADELVALIESARPPHDNPARLSVDGTPVLTLTTGGMPPIPWVRAAPLHQMPVLVQPDGVRGFAHGEPLTPDARRFLDEVREAMGRLDAAIP